MFNIGPSHLSIICFLCLTATFSGCAETEKSPNETVSKLPSKPQVIEIDSAPSVTENEETEVEFIHPITGYSTDCDTVYETFPKDTQYQCMILSPGTYHNEEVNPNWANSSWVGLFKNGDVFVRKTRVIIEPGYDALMDKDGEKSGWNVVAADSADTCYFLLSGFKPARLALLDPIIHRRTKMLPNDSLRMEFKRHNYLLHASGNVYNHQTSDEWPEISSYRLTLEKDGIEQIIFATYSFNDRLPHIYFIGDLDGDKKLDIILDASRHYNTFEPVLYLSTLANDGELVGCAAYHVSMGC
ncbi:MAG TPA: hypothetical protein DCX14_10205 [Flavobacteriales bacterium]|jgi:hypothetical protein|nr:hypothetical protein [Flavobacteriales bacterium]